MGRISLHDLNARQIALLSPEDRKELGLKTNEEVFAKAAKGFEKAEHDLVLSWSSLHRLEPIHAACHRKVHDLPPGWPDFTFCVMDRVLFVEMKVEGGRLNEDQIRMHAILGLLGCTVHITGSALETMKLVGDWCESLGYSL